MEGSQNTDLGGDIYIYIFTQLVANVAGFGTREFGVVPPQCTLQDFFCAQRREMVVFYVMHSTYIVLTYVHVPADVVRLSLYAEVSL